MSDNNHNGDFTCPNCGTDGELYQTVRKTERVHTDDEGHPEQFEAVGEITPLSLECDTCDTVIFDEADGG